MSLFTPFIYHGFDRLAGVRNLAEFVGHAFILVSGWQASASLLFLVHRHEPDRARRMVYLRGGLVLMTLVGAGTFFALIPTSTDTTRFTTEYAHAPYITHYWVTFLVAVNLLLADVVRLLTRYASKSSRDPLRIGLRFTAFGVAAGITYWAHWIVFLVLRGTAVGTPAWLDAWGTVSAIAAVLLIVIGSTIPALGRVGLRAPATMWQERRLWNRLEPLWRALTEEFPAIVLPERASGDTQLHYRLYRRRVEVLDGMLALHPYRDAVTEHRAREHYHAAGVEGIALDAAVEAAGIDHALRARRNGASPHDVPAMPPDHAEDPVWLARVSAEFVRLQDDDARPWERQVVG